MDTKIQTLLDRKGHEVYSIRADQTVYEAIAEMDARHVGGLIVKDGDGSLASSRNGTTCAR